MCKYLSMWMHVHIYSWKLSPGLVLFAKVCPLFNLYGFLFFGINKALSSTRCKDKLERFIEKKLHNTMFKTGLFSSKFSAAI